MNSADTVADWANRIRSQLERFVERSEVVSHDAEVPERVYAAFLAAGSAGAFFRRHVRGAYPCRKVRGG